MASIIRIKRSLVAGNPSVLAAGELAYSAADYSTVAGGGRLYIGIGAESNGDAASHLVIGGQYFTDKLDHSPGTLTASSAIIVDSNKKIDDFYVDNLRLNGNTISSTDANGNILIDPDGSGYVQIVGTNALVIPSGTSIQQAPAVAGAIRLNTDTGQFEGYSGSNWASLGGVRSVDGLTYISAELTPGASDDTIRAYTNNTLAFQIDDNSAQFESKIGTVTIAATTVSSSDTTGALVVAGGIGVAGNIYVGGNINAASASFDSINNTPIGNITPSTGAFTQLDVDNIRVNGNTISSTNINGDINITPNGSGKTVISNVYVGSDTVSLQEYIQDISGGQLIAGTGISVVYNDTLGETTISGVDATTTTKGIASFTSGDFTVTSGAVSLASTVVKSVTTDSGALTPSGNSISILGGEGMDVTHVGSTITVAGEDATTSNKGIASFDSGDFSVTSGAVSIKSGGVANSQLENSSVTVGSTTISLGGTSTSLAGLTEVTVDNININDSTISATNLNGNIVLAPNGTGTVDISGKRISGLADPVNAQDAATKNYVDNAISGLTWKASAHLLASTNVALTGSTNTLVIDGHPALTSAESGYRILLINQTTGSEDGIYVYTDNGTTYTLTRPVDANTYQELIGAAIFIKEGTTYESSGWVQTNHYITDFSNQEWVQFSGAGAYVAGDGLGQNGNEFFVNVAATGGIEIVADALQLKSSVAGDGLTYTNGVLDILGVPDRITVSSDSVDIASTYVGQNSITTLGTITTGTWNGTIIGVEYGGTGLGNYSYGDLLVGSVTGSLTTLAVGTSGKVLQSNGSTVVYGDVDGGTY